MKAPLLKHLAVAALGVALVLPAGTAFAGGGGRPYWKNTVPGVGTVQRGNNLYRYDNNRGRWYRSGRAYRGHGWHRHRNWNNNDGAFVAGALGLAAGALIGSTLAQPRQYAPAPARVSYQPWTPEWYSYCSRKYRSFNPRTGYYTTYSGYQRFCR